MTAIVIVEDNADLAYGLRNDLEIEGYDVDVARDGPSGLTRAGSSRPDLVILDLMLPGLDGYRVLKALRRRRVRYAGADPDRSRSGGRQGERIPARRRRLSHQTIWPSSS